MDESAEARNVALAIDWLSRRDPAKPFLLKVSLNAPHTPAVCPARYLPLIHPDRIRLPFPSDRQLAGQPKRESELLRGFQGVQRLGRDQLRKARHYDYARVAFADAMFSRLLDWMRPRGLLDTTIVAFLGDHGSHLGDQGMLQKQTFYEQVLSVPYFFWWKEGVKSGVRLNTPVNILSLLPTLLELSGLPPGNAQAPSLAPMLRTGEEPPRNPVCSAIAFGYQGYRDRDRQVMVRDGDYKLLLFPDGGDPDGALYNLRREPGESNTLFRDAAQRAIVERLRAQIRQWDASRQYSPAPASGPQASL